MRVQSLSEEKKRREGEAKPLARLTSRDKQLLAHVALARYLSARQLRKLVFASGKDDENESTAVVCRRRLGKLCEGEAPYLRRLQYRSEEGGQVSAYTATPHGYAVARQVLRRAPPIPMQDIKAQFLEHTVTMNDLYVALADGCVKQRLGPAQFPFWWISTESTVLPWRERNERTGIVEERRLMPDAILELAGERVRIFLECEMGGHPLARRDENAQGSALSKLQRYAAFMVEGSPRTFYEQRYPDGWKAELVFLVHSDERASNLARLIGSWRESNRASTLLARSFSFRQAPAHFCARLRLPRPSRPPVGIETEDLQLACTFVSQVTTTYKAVRHFLRANPAIRAQGCPYPEYSAEFERMVAFTERVRGVLGSKS